MKRCGLTVPPLRNDPEEVEKLLRFVGPTAKQLRFCSDPRHCICKTDDEMARCLHSTRDMDE